MYTEVNALTSKLKLEKMRGNRINLQGKTNHDEGCKRIEGHRIWSVEVR
jgi:hypothetical protein